MSTNLKSSLSARAQAALNTILSLAEKRAEKNDLHRGPINDDLALTLTWTIPWFDPSAESILSAVEGLRTGKLTTGKTTLCTRRSHHHDA